MDKNKLKGKLELCSNGISHIGEGNWWEEDEIQKKKGKRDKWTQCIHVWKRRTFEKPRRHLCITQKKKHAIAANQ